MVCSLFEDQLGALGSEGEGEVIPVVVLDDNNLLYFLIAVLHGAHGMPPRGLSPSYIYEAGGWKVPGNL